MKSNKPKKLSLIIVSAFLINCGLVSNLFAQSNSWMETKTNSTTGFIPNLEPNCRNGYCPNNPGGLSSQVPNNFLAQANSRAISGFSGNSYYAASINSANQYTKYISLTTNTFTAPLLNTYYESVGAGNAWGAVTAYDVRGNGFFMVSCPANDTKRTGFKIISAGSNTFVANYFITCIGINSSGNNFVSFTENAQIVFRPTAAINPLENELHASRLNLAQTKIQADLTSQNGVSWFQKYARRVFP